MALKDFWSMTDWVKQIFYIITDVYLLSILFSKERPLVYSYLAEFERVFKHYNTEVGH